MRKNSLLVLIATVLLWQSMAKSISASSNQDFDKILSTSWQAYKRQFIQADGRVIDWTNNKITTSEGQSYALLRAVWMNDRQTFDTTLKWTYENLRARGDNLFSWKWGLNSTTQKWEVLDKSAASDADQDIALALLLAYRRWHQREMLAQARAIIADIWNAEIVEINGQPYLVAGDWAKSMPAPALNPSYFAPYAYRLFAEIAPERDWNGLIDSSYRVLEESTKLSNVNLPPDWCSINRETGAIEPIQLNGEVSGDYSYDAWRAMWRVSLDAIWYDEPRAKNFIKRAKFIFDFWRKHEHLAEAFTKDGAVRSDVESIAALGVHLPAFSIIDKKTAKRIYEERLLASYRRLGERGFWGNPNDYYGQNWAWFGIALYAGALNRF